MINFKVEFADPLYISTGQTKDFLRVDFLNTDYFYSKTSHLTIKATTLELKKPIPRQILGDSSSMLGAAA